MWLVLFSPKSCGYRRHCWEFINYLQRASTYSYVLGPWRELLFNYRNYLKCLIFILQRRQMSLRQVRKADQEGLVSPTISGRAEFVLRSPWRSLKALLSTPHIYAPCTWENSIEVSWFFLVIIYFIAVIYITQNLSFQPFFMCAIQWY